VTSIGVCRVSVVVDRPALSSLEREHGLGSCAHVPVTSTRKRNFPAYLQERGTFSFSCYDAPSFRSWGTRTWLLRAGATCQLMQDASACMLAWLCSHGLTAAPLLTTIRSQHRGVIVLRVARAVGQLWSGGHQRTGCVTIEERDAGGERTTRMPAGSYLRECGAPQVDWRRSAGRRSPGEPINLLQGVRAALTLLLLRPCLV